MHAYDICAGQTGATLHLQQRQPVIISFTVVVLQLLSCLLLRVVCHDTVQYHDQIVFRTLSNVADTQEVKLQSWTVLQHMHIDICP